VQLNSIYRNMAFGLYSKFHGTESLQGHRGGQLTTIPSKAGHNSGIQKVVLGAGNANGCISTRSVAISGKIDDSASRPHGFNRMLTRPPGRGNSEAPDCPPHPRAAP
jgi:hypothetical protein